jgi:hypothetical protein
VQGTRSSKNPSHLLHRSGVALGCLSCYLLVLVMGRNFSENRQVSFEGKADRLEQTVLNYSTTPLILRLSLSLLCAAPPLLVVFLFLSGAVPFPFWSCSVLSLLRLPLFHPWNWKRPHAGLRIFLVFSARFGTITALRLQYASSSPPISRNRRCSKRSWRKQRGSRWGPRDRRLRSSVSSSLCSSILPRCLVVYSGIVCYSGC